jgi:hypothetical protein
MKVIKWILCAVLISTLLIQYDDGELKLSAAYSQDDGTLVINWIPPTEYTDGFPLLEQDLDFYTFYCNGSVVKQIDNVVGTHSNSVDVSGFERGDHDCSMTVTSLLGATSAASNSITFTLGPRVPGSPVLTT